MAQHLNNQKKTMQTLTKTKAKWARNRDVVLRGTRLNYNAGDQIRYQRALLELVTEMTLETKRRVTRLFETGSAEEFFEQQNQAAMDAKDEDIADKANTLMNVLTAKFNALFGRKAESLAEAMLSNAKKTSKTTLHESLKTLSGGLSLKTGVVPRGMGTVARAITQENADLIKTIPQEYLGKVSGAVMRSITTGNGLADLVPQIRKYSEQSNRKVELLALDQTRKAYNTINKQRLQDLGVKKFEWIHSGGGQKPRKSHIAMNGKIFSFDDLPVINKEQVDRGYESPEHGIPGQAINCRCVMKPVIEFDDDED
jgi:SPP1 gp7 family putative phage head morphogenesis protein